MGKGYQMTTPTENQVETPKQDTKELNFANLRAKYERELDKERAEKVELERKLKEASSKDDDDDSEPYVDQKKLERKLTKYSQTTQSEIQKAMEVAKDRAKEEIKQEMWLENNPDFYDILKHAEAFAARAPKLAETILRMPEGFERQKLVYQNIKELGIDKPPQKQSSIQEKVDANRRSPYYQPSGTGTAPYAANSDFSAAGQESAYKKMQELKKNLRI